MEKILDGFVLYNLRETGHIIRPVCLLTFYDIIVIVCRKSALNYKSLNFVNRDYVRFSRDFLYKEQLSFYLKGFNKLVLRVTEV